MAEPARSSDPKRLAFYERIGGYSMSPLWESLHVLVSSEPRTPAVAHQWKYDDEVRPYLMEAGGLLSAKEAERRVLILENPGLPGKA